jgi:hypothetical protein
MKQIIFFFLAFLMFSGCKKIIYGMEDGIYTGQWSWVMADTTINLPVTVVLTGKEYYCSGAEGSESCYSQFGGSGTYKIRHDKIIFTDAHVYPANISTHQVLQGEFKYNSKKDKLLLTLNTGNGINVEYNLVRENK